MCNEKINMDSINMSMIKDYGLVSIITPNYNCVHFIAETIRSVQAQTYQNWEMIIVDDCSTDGSDKVVQLYMEEDKRIRFLKNPKNSGAAISRNYALREAKGKWIAFIDSDDLWLPEKLEKQIKFMVDHNYHFSYSKRTVIDQNGIPMNIELSGPSHISRQGMLNYCWVGCLSAMYDAEFVGLIQIEDIKKNNDYAIWLKVINKCDCYLLDDRLAMYRRGRTGSISNHSYIRLIKWHYILWHDGEHYGPISSVILTVRNLFFGIVKKICYVNKM